MSLSESYGSFQEYFTDCLDFFKEFHWVFSSPNTHILTNRVFDKIPDEWKAFFNSLSNEELNQVMNGQLFVSAKQTTVDYVG